MIIKKIIKNSKHEIRNLKWKKKTQQRFKSETHNVFTEEINKIVLSSNDDKRMRSIDLIETYEYGTSKGLEEIKCSINMLP